MFRALTLAACLLAAPVQAQDVRMRSAGADARVEAMDGTQARVFARRLGRISAMAQGGDGTLFVADEDTGRIFRIADRGRDGRADSRQSLPHRFDMPSGLAVDERTLFVADRSGLWVVEPTGTPRLLAPFANSGATDAPHPIAVRPDGTVLLGLSKPDGTALLLSVDIDTGRATQVDAGAGEVMGFADIPGLDAKVEPETEALFPRIRTPWMVLRTAQGARIAPARAGGFAAAIPVSGDALSVLMNPEKGPAMVGTPDGLFLVESSVTGVALSEQFVMRGARADAIISDSARTLIADRESGHVWVLLPAKAEVVEPEPAPLPDPLDTPPEALLLRGSAIDGASRLVPGKPTTAQPDGETE